MFLYNFLTFVVAVNVVFAKKSPSWFDEELSDISQGYIPKGDDYTEKMAIVISKMQENSSASPNENDLYVKETFGGEVCDLKASPKKPTSVHQLRPGDIQVVAAMGDSLSAGNGILATNLLTVLVQYRGFAFSIGGSESAETHLTLPNILKKANENLHGFSIGGSFFKKAEKVFNVAEPGNKAEDMPGQARTLVKKMKQSSKIDFQNDWKMVTLFVGGNDVCDYCKDKRAFSPENYEKHLIEALDILHEELPKTFVNLIEVLDVSLVRELKNKNWGCDKLLSWFLCKCVAGAHAKPSEVKQYIRGYQQAVRNIMHSGRYDTRKDFTVVVQPFLRDSKPGRQPNGKYDMSLFSPDCFHFGRKGHDLAGKSFWNNLLQPVGKKDSVWSPRGKVNCPTENRPYLATTKNS